MTSEDYVERIQRGETDLLSQLWDATMKIIAYRAKKYYALHMTRCNCTGVTADDLIQEGYFAFLDAVKAYDPSTGYKFSTFLKYPILRRFANATGFESGKRDPLNQSVSLDAPANDDISDFSEILPDESAEIPFEEILNDDQHERLCACLDACMADMPPDQVAVIRARYYENKSTEEIAASMGCSRPTVNSKEERALMHFRKPRNARQLAPFIDIDIDGTSGHSFRAYKERGYESKVELLALKLCENNKKGR